MDPATDEIFSQAALSRARIFQAAETLLESDDLEAITVKQICGVAQISKATFYKYFQDKYDIIQWCTDLFFGIGVKRIGRSLTWEQGHLISTTGYLKHPHLVRKAFRSKDYNGIQLYSIRRRENNLMETLENYRHVKVTETLRMQVIALAAAETAVFRRILLEWDEYDLDAIVKTMLQIVPSQLYDLLATPVAPQDDALESALARVEFIDRLLSLPGADTHGKAPSD